MRPPVGKMGVERLVLEVAVEVQRRRFLEKRGSKFKSESELARS